jgi:hypothetical protein
MYIEGRQDMLEFLRLYKKGSSIPPNYTLSIRLDPDILDFGWKEQIRASALDQFFRYKVRYGDFFEKECEESLCRAASGDFSAFGLPLSSKQSTMLQKVLAFDAAFVGTLGWLFSHNPVFAAGAMAFSYSSIRFPRLSSALFATVFAAAAGEWLLQIFFPEAGIFLKSAFSSFLAIPAIEFLRAVAVEKIRKTAKVLFALKSQSEIEPPQDGLEGNG